MCMDFAVSDVETCHFCWFLWNVRYLSWFIHAFPNIEPHNSDSVISEQDLLQVQLGACQQVLKCISNAYCNKAY
jgi:hypothetical protein